MGYISQMDRNEFEDIAAQALESVPEWFREKLQNIDIVVESEPPAHILKEMGIGRGSTLLGLYQGVPLSRRGFYYGNVLPDRIALYMGPILRNSGGGGPEDIARTVREVVIHEIGHYFGFSDAELEELEGRR